MLKHLRVSGAGGVAGATPPGRAPLPDAAATRPFPRRCVRRRPGVSSQPRPDRDLPDGSAWLRDPEATFLHIVSRWGQSIESADRYTQGHCVRVADRACALATAVGFDDRTLFWFRLGALLHDLGKIVVPPEILSKPGPLTPEERAIMERHPDAGVELIDDLEFPWDVRPMVRHHHEAWDGSGYPAHLAGEDIPLSARILCVADVYDALVTNRPYRTAYSHEQTLQIMQADAGHIFDPTLFSVFREVCGTPAATASSV